MCAEIVKLPQVPRPTIEQALEEFLAEQRSSLKPRTMAKYEETIDLLRHYLNRYAVGALPKKERAFYYKCCEARGKKRRQFCQLFGPEKIIENLALFLYFFMVHDVEAGADFKRATGTTTEKLSKWLAAKGYVSEELARTGTFWGAKAARELPRAERASRILYEALRYKVRFHYPYEEDYLDFDCFAIARIEPGKLWLKPLQEGWGKKTLGPIIVPKKATELLEEGWSIECALERFRGQWRILDVGGVLPI